MDSNNTPQNQPESPAPAQPVAPAAPGAAPASGNGSGFAIAALVLGIIAFLFGWLGFLNLLTAILAVVFGVVALTKHQSKGMALTGLILGGIALVASVIWGIVGIAALQSAQESLKESGVRSSQNSTSDSTSKKWDYAAGYAKLATGMTKEEVETALGKSPESCSVSDSEFTGTLEFCSYGSLGDGASVSVTFTDGKLSSKSKYDY